MLITLFTSIQTLYLEGMRLRTRDLPSLQYFKIDLEPRLNLRSEEGALTFSLWKHTCLVLFGVLMLAAGGRRRLLSTAPEVAGSVSASHGSA